MRLIQLVSDITGEPIGLYTCSNDDFTEEQTSEIMTNFHELNENVGIERIYVEQEITVD